MVNARNVVPLFIGNMKSILMNCLAVAFILFSCLLKWESSLNEYIPSRKKKKSFFWEIPHSRFLKAKPSVDFKNCLNLLKMLIYYERKVLSVQLSIAAAIIKSCFLFLLSHCSVKFYTKLIFICSNSIVTWYQRHWAAIRGCKTIHIFLVNVQLKS